MTKEVKAQIKLNSNNYIFSYLTGLIQLGSGINFILFTGTFHLIDRILIQNIFLNTLMY